MEAQRLGSSISIRVRFGFGKVLTVSDHSGGVLVGFYSLHMTHFCHIYLYRTSYLLDGRVKIIPPYHKIPKYISGV